MTYSAKLPMSESQSWLPPKLDVGLAGFFLGLASAIATKSIDSTGILGGLPPSLPFILCFSPFSSTLAGVFSISWLRWRAIRRRRDDPAVPITGRITRCEFLLGACICRVPRCRLDDRADGRNFVVFVGPAGPNVRPRVTPSGFVRRHRHGRVLEAICSCRFAMVGGLCSSARLS